MKGERKIKIDYVTSYDARNVGTWSGLGHYIAEALKKQGAEINYIGNLKQKVSRVARIRKWWFGKTCKGMMVREDMVTSVMRSYARQVEPRLDPDADILLCPGNYAVTMVRTDKPVVIYGDANYGLLNGYYADFPPYYLRAGLLQERRMQEKSALLIYSSEWAAGSAVEDFGTDPTKVKVVPFGANIESKRTEADIEAFIQTRLASPTCNLLFVGVDWKRKGGAKAVAVATRLHEMGVPVRLDIVGIREPLDLPGFAVNHGFISKDTAAGCKKIDSLFAQAHFFILPTQAECFGVVFSEASSFGLPSLATDTGGVGGAVRDGINGMKFTSDANPQQWADYIAKLWQDKAAYEKLALSSFHEYETRLNWDVAGKAIMGHIREILEKRKQTR